MTCRHENIYWEDFFKSEKQNNYQYRHKNAYCMDCDAKKGHNFAVRCQLWYAEKVREWLKSNGLTKLYTLNNEEIHSYNDFEEFIDNNNYRKQWDKLQSGGVDPNYFDGFGGQSLFFETARSIEHLCQEFKKEKEQEIPNDREREREQIRKKIKRLEQKTNRTPEEEQELENLRTKLRELENSQESKPVNYLPWIIGSSILVGGIIILVLLFKKSKKRGYY